MYLCLRIRNNGMIYFQKVEISSLSAEIRDDLNLIIFFRGVFLNFSQGAMNMEEKKNAGFLMKVQEA